MKKTKAKRMKKKFSRTMKNRQKRHHHNNKRKIKLKKRKKLSRHLSMKLMPFLWQTSKCAGLLNAITNQ